MISSTIRSRFIAVNESMGLGPDDYTAGPTRSIVAPKGETEVVLNQTGDCALKGLVFQTDDLEQLRRIVLSDRGLHSADVQVLSDLYKGVDTNVLNKLEAGDLDENPSDAEQAELIKVASLYVFGHSNISPEALKKLNTLLFPAKAVTYTCGLLEIGPNTDLVVESRSPVILNFETVHIAPSSRIVLHSKASLFVGELEVTEKTSEDHRSCDETVYVVARPWDPAKAQTGEMGTSPPQAQQGEPGENQFDKEKNVFVCTRQPGDGHPGAAGNPGGPGVNGMAARHTEPANIDIYQVLGPVSIVAEGGSGQDGGDGGQGGDGGPGGFGGMAPSGCAPARAGLSGPGGVSGPGGDGGDASQVTEPVRIVKNCQGFSIVARAGSGGVGGAGGAPGESPDGNGFLGGKGRGKDGKSGIAPLVFTVDN